MIKILEDTNSNPFRTDTTGMSGYDQYLDPDNLDYLQREKNRTGEIQMMSPTEYITLCADKVFTGHDTSVDKLIKSRRDDKIQGYKERMRKGEKAPLPVLNLADKGQEGIHRMICAGDLYGWDSEFPVLVITPYDQKREDDNAAKQALQSIVYWLEDSWNDNIESVIYKVSQKLNYKLTSKDVETLLEKEIIDVIKRVAEYDTDVVCDINTRDDSIKVYVIDIDGLSIHKNNTIFDGKLSDYFNSYNGIDLDLDEEEISKSNKITQIDIEDLDDIDLDDLLFK